MKFYKKATLSVAVLAMLGGLAGCGSQNASKPSHHTETSKQRSDDSKNFYADRQKIANEESGTLNLASSAFKQTSPLEAKYSDNMNVMPGELTIHGKVYSSNVFRLYKLPKGVKADQMTDHGPSNNARGNDNKDYNYSLPYKDVFKAFWKDTYRGIQRKGLNKRRPGVYLYWYINGNPNDAKTNSSAVYYAFSNSPKLHLAHKGQFKEDGSGMTDIGSVSNED